MKLHFEPDLDYQRDAIEAVCDLFNGQEICRSEFTVIQRSKAGSLIPGFGEGIGIGNRLSIPPEEILENLQKIQTRNGLKPAAGLSSMNFTVEMETGTGKTYVYLRTIFELNKQYGFTKFVIVVPSIAIKEGVYKTLQITEDHFQTLYANVPFNYFTYDSSKMNQVYSFATSPSIQVMVMTVGAINKKDVNNLYKDSEKTGGEKPIDLIRETKPVVIVDEPQSVDGGLEGRGKEALDSMNPLCTLRYSATHVDKHHMVYCLDAVDAYQRKLVKQIEVASLTVESGYNKPYVKFLSAQNRKWLITATVELDIQSGSHVSRERRTVQDGDNLDQTTGRSLYESFRIGEIRCTKGKELLEVRTPQEDFFLSPNESINDVDGPELKRHMIRRTIKEHLDKEKMLRSRGIKVLSLFFIDRVDRYRVYGENGSVQKGDYARMFEEEYRRFLKYPDYQGLFGRDGLPVDPEEVHNGYFSADKNQRWVDTSENTQASRDDAERAYSLIMRDKERLLSFDTNLRFIFSHSALKEGWDNPNVFQIVVLRDVGTEIARRQIIGRGLRLCVNQEGERVREVGTNTLTVIASESYEQFAENLQKEIEEDSGIRFGIVEKHQFASLQNPPGSGSQAVIGVEKSEVLWNHLKDSGYLDSKGKVQEPLKKALVAKALVLPVEFEPLRLQIQELLAKIAVKLEIHNADERIVVKARQAVLDSEEFRSLWNRIKHKTTYRVSFDNKRLLEDCAKAIREAPPVRKTRVVTQKAQIEVDRGGVYAAEDEAEYGSDHIKETDIELPDLLTYLQDKTHLTRRSLVKILLESDRLSDFTQNPQEFLEVATYAINGAKHHALVDGIKYQRIGEEAYYAQELFETEELTGYLKNMLKTEKEKSAYEYVVYDSEGVEQSFAKELEENNAVKVYAKLPGWFSVPTPLGTYNPDWAVLIERDGEERVYLVVETKGSLSPDSLRALEKAKISCGKAHFEALAVELNPAQFEVATNLKDLLAH